MGANMKYMIEVTYVFVVEAENPQDAEDMGWDHWVKNPQTDNSVQPSLCNIVEPEDDPDEKDKGRL
jgi:hypothetical protein